LLLRVGGGRGRKAKGREREGKRVKEKGVAVSGEALCAVPVSVPSELTVNRNET
jgi:hypothetical protein